MTCPLRQKLLNWLCSIGLVLLTTILAIVIQWFEIAPLLLSEDAMGNSEAVWRLAEPLLVYVLLTPVFLFWHFFDLIERQIDDAVPQAKFALYRSFLMVMIFGIVLLTMMSLGIWQYNSCDELDGALFHQCYIQSSFWLMGPWLAAMACAIFLCLFKAVYSIRSLIKNS